MPPFHLFGLTGGIASGKSTVAAYLRAASPLLEVVDADALYHELIAPQHGRPSPLARAIAELFGDPDALLDGDGALRRGPLGSRVFADATARRALEGLTHPAVHQRAQQRFDEARNSGKRWVFYDVPLLFERNMADMFEGVMVVWVPLETQLVRLRTRNGLDEASAKARIAAQMPLDAKRTEARWVIDNAGTQAQTHEQLERVLNELKAI